MLGDFQSPIILAISFHRGIITSQNTVHEMARFEIGLDTYWITDQDYFLAWDLPERLLSFLTFYFISVAHFYIKVNHFFFIFFYIFLSFFFSLGKLLLELLLSFATASIIFPVFLSNTFIHSLYRHT